MPNDENKIILEFPATNVEIELGETITFDNISGFLDAERVTYNSDSLTEIITHLENDKADTTYVNTELAKKADKTDTYTKTQVDNALNNKMDKAHPTGTGSFSLNRKANTTIGYRSVATGYNTTASGSQAHSEGAGTIASGNNSHSEGAETTASGERSHAEGLNTEAKGNNQHVSGKYNIVDNNDEYAEIIGNGTSESNRSNARTLDWNGNETLAGNLIFNGNTSLTSEISRLDDKIDTLPAPMIFKGTLGVGGTIQSLPTASTNNEGWTYKVITDGTYAGQTAKVGDLFTSNGSAWVYIPSGDEDNDTWRAIKVNGVEKLGNGISSGAVDFVGSENIEVEFDANGNKVGVKTKNIYTKTEVDDIVYGIFPDDTASGSVANFTTSLELPIKSIEVDVNAVQASGTPTPATPLPISGWSEVSLVKRGVNLWDEVVELGRLNNDGTLNSSQTTRITTDFISVKPNQTYRQTSPSVAYGGIICFYDKNKSCVRCDGNGVRESTKTFTTQDGEYYVRITLGYQYGTTYNNDISINYPSSDTAYHAYNPNGTTEVINLGGTYYGGYFTQDKDGHRQFVATHEYETNMGQYNYTYVSASNCFRTTNFNKAYKRTDYSIIANSLCSHYGGAKLQEVLNQSANNSTYAFGIVGLYNGSVLFRNTNYSDATAFKSSMQGVSMTFELETPIIIDLPDGEPINTFIGTNNIFADTGDTSVVFKDSVNGYVEKKIASVQALALNT